MQRWKDMATDPHLMQQRDSSSSLMWAPSHDRVLTLDTSISNFVFLLCFKIIPNVARVFQKVTAFTQDAISLTTGEELKCGERLNVFSTLRRDFGKWKHHLDCSGQNCEYLILVAVCNCLSSTLHVSRTLKLSLCIAVNERIEREVTDYEERYRGRELPGFINYKTFEVMVKDQIRLLEEPAVRKLKEIGGMHKFNLLIHLLFLVPGGSVPQFMHVLQRSVRFISFHSHYLQML